METRLHLENQYANEERYSRKHIEKQIEESIKKDPDVCVKAHQGLILLKEWLNQEYYPSKNIRLEQVKTLDLEQLVWDIYTFIACMLKPDLFTSVVAQLASRIGFNEKRDGIQTMSEILAVLANTDIIDVFKDPKKGKYSPVYIKSNVNLQNRFRSLLEHSEYLPPMVVEPLELTHNRSSGYLTVKGDSLILGKGNHHDGDICLDVLNKMNKVALSIDKDFLSVCEEEANFDLDTAEKKEQWDNFKKQSYYFYSLLANQADQIYLTHKVDKRGRIYSQGYHITTQGTGFKKAMLELAKKEKVDVSDLLR